MPRWKFFGLFFHCLLEATNVCPSCTKLIKHFLHFPKTLQKSRPTYQWLVVSWMCFTLVGFGPGLLIQFGLTCAKLYPFFPTTQGCCTRGNPCLFAEINLFPCKIKVQYVFVWATPRCVFGIWNGNAEKTCPEIVIIFCLVGLPGDISIGFIVEIWWECKIWQKIISLTISVLPSHRQFFLGHGTDNYHVFAPDGNWKLRLPKRGLEKQNPSCTAQPTTSLSRQVLRWGFMPVASLPCLPHLWKKLSYYLSSHEQFWNTV